MSETAEEQRIRLHKKRQEIAEEPLIKCLECPLSFIRVGSHVVQVHGYENVAEYRREHGLMARETAGAVYRNKMRTLARNYDNLEKGISTRFKPDDGHGQRITEFWKNRRANGLYTRPKDTRVGG